MKKYSRICEAVAKALRVTERKSKVMRISSGFWDRSWLKRRSLGEGKRGGGARAANATSEE